MSERWDELTGDSDIPAWDALPQVWRKALEGLGYGPLSYPYYVERYKKWYDQPNATYNLYRYLERLQDQNFGGHGSEHIEHDFEDRAERARLQAALAAANARAQAAEARLAAILERAANVQLDEDDPLVALNDIEAIAKGES